MKSRSPPEKSEGNPFKSSKPTGVFRGPGNAKDSNEVNGNDDKRKRVNVGIEGETPKKVFSIERDDPSKAVDLMANIKESSGEDESDEFTDQSSQPESEAQDVEDNHNGNSNKHSAADVLHQLATENNSFERPKTSRGKSHPSPDEFFNYVVPSPEENRRGGRSRFVISKDDASQSQVSVQDDAVSTTSSTRHIKWNDSTPTTELLESDAYDLSNANDNDENEERHELSDNYLLGINLDGVSRDKQIALLGCWLFGSALRI